LGVKLIDIDGRMYHPVVKAGQITRQFQGAGGVEQCIEFTRRHMSAGSCQIPWEIESAMARIAQASPRIMGEIGTSFGGTSLLFTRFLPTLEKLFCIDLYVKNKEILRLLAPPKLELRFFDMPSYAEDSVERVRKFLGGRMIDVLFIDGDHAYESVRNELNAIFSAIPDASALAHDSFFQSADSNYNVGPALAIDEVVGRFPARFKVIKSGLGLPGMTLLATV